MTDRRVLAIGGTLAIILATSACAAGPPVARAGESRQPAAVQRVERADVRAAPPIGGVSRLTTLPQRIGKQDQSVAALAPDGAIVLSRSAAPDPKHPLAVHQTRLLLAPGPRRLDGARPIPLGPRRAQPQQAGYVAIDRRWVVWQETPSTDLAVQPWSMYAYDRVARSTRLIARSPRLDGGVSLSSPGWTGPVLWGDHLAWAETVGTQDRPRSRIRACVLPCDASAVVIDGAAYPQASGAGVTAVATPQFAGRSGASARRRAEIVRVSYAGERRLLQRLILSRGRDVNGLAVDGPGYAWTVSGDAGTSITVVRRGRTTTIEGLASQGFGSPVLTRRSLLWAEESGAGAANVGGYLYDLASRRLVSLGNTSGLYAVLLAGDYLSWQESRRPSDPRAPIDDVIARLRRAGGAPDFGTGRPMR